MPNPSLSSDHYQTLAQRKGLTWLGPAVNTIRAQTRWRCQASGHEFSRAYRHIKAGRGCPQCNTPQPLDSLPDTPLGHHIREFIQLKQRAWRPKTRAIYTNLLTRFSLYSHNSDQKWPLQPGDILDWLNSTAGNNTSIRTYFNHLRTFFNYLQTIGVLDEHSNPVRQIARLRLLPKKPQQIPKGLSQPDIANLLLHLWTLAQDDADLGAQRDLALIHFTLITGCRASELASLRRADLDLNLLSATIQPATAKTHTARTVFYNPAVRDDLETWLATLDKSDYQDGYVFSQLKNNRPRGHLTGSGVGQLFKRRLVQAGLPPNHIHALRHTAALHAFHNGVSLEQISAQLGHADITTTTIYLRGHDPARAAAYANLNTPS